MIDPTNPKHTWYVTVCPRAFDPGMTTALCRPAFTSVFTSKEGAMNALNSARLDGANWGKCYAYRDTDSRYLFEAEFQQRT